ncbi:hypothetical protein PV326_013830, partial [Microctonus aethiopoides]
MSHKVDDLKLDIDELALLLHQAKRQKTKDVLELQMRKLQTELSKLTEITMKNNENKCVKTNTSSETKCYEVKLTNYCWDESDKFMKLYVTLNKVQTLPSESINCDFTERSINLRVMGLENRNYQLPISNLCEEIDPTKSHYKVKNDMIVIFLAKKAPKTWSHVTKIEKTIKDSKTTKPDMDDHADPESSLMNLMKKMYQDGDDNMKRTIAKAWTESQDKKSAGLSDFPS